ncbi:LacI family transcriptional regulator [Halobacillus andaensis]|uniref:LacI family transcriptional regulator n=1 Tax=Halobacillus andaensis TaxID=1176239 RepID=A0A917B6F1_HALAA|nr:LacI family DNA-binding transcriptional regulator [Halobacillus andaensis]MBP2006425.1 LacI family transcriptional regulator [Halobacillus andaensis]GGF27300.1 LacI family transcriptional regulator [Halobacillus andaensis]
MSTLKDVAKKAKVSVATASYVMNGSELITKPTKDKVLLAAKELGYRPNGNAKNLKKNKTNIIGLFLSGFTGPFFNELLEGIQDTVIKRGYEMVVCASDDKHRLLLERYVDGAIILNFHISNELLNGLASDKFPIVVLDRELVNPHVKQMLLPNKLGMDYTVNHLVEKGHKRIGFIAGSKESFDGESRLEGFKESLADHGLSFNESDLIRADFTEISALLSMNKFLEANEEFPTAFVSANDEMAMGAIKAVQQRGLKVPEDIAFVGFDDIDLSRYVQPALTTVRVEKKRWGQMAAETLFDMLEKNTDPKELEIPIEFVPRQSS